MSKPKPTSRCRSTRSRRLLEWVCAQPGRCARSSVGSRARRRRHRARAARRPSCGADASVSPRLPGRLQSRFALPGWHLEPLRWPTETTGELVARGPGGARVDLCFTLGGARQPLPGRGGLPTRTDQRSRQRQGRHRRVGGAPPRTPDFGGLIHWRRRRARRRRGIEGPSQDLPDNRQQTDRQQIQLQR